MATKYGPRKRSNAGTSRKSTNNTGGSRTRTTQTTKFGNVTKSRSVNRNGTIRQTTTHKSPSGWITRSVKTVGSAPSKPKAPKFIKAKPFKAPKIRIPKFTSSRSYSSGRSRSYRGGGGSKADGFIVGLFFAAIVLFFAAIWWTVKQFTIGLWGAAQIAIKQEEKNWWYWTKVSFIFIAFLYITVLFFYFIFTMIL